MPLHELAVAREEAISLGHVIRSHREHDHEVRLSHVRHAVPPVESALLRAAIIRPGAGSAAAANSRQPIYTPRANRATARRSGSSVAGLARYWAGMSAKNVEI